MEHALGLWTDRLLGNVAWEDFERPLRAVCITLYNEPLAALTATLRSLVESSRRQPEGTRGMCLCIMADGVERLDPAVLEFLIDRGYAEYSADTQAATQFFLSRHAASEWGVGTDGDLAALNFIVCLKPCNRGKLHSHALFFGLLCPRLDPMVCCQIDAGTTVHPLALGTLTEHLQKAPEVGAVGARIGVAPPGPADGLLQRWQYMDFAVQTAAHWPAELLSGHLSVVPGQFCAFRWEALARRELDVNDRPVSRYLRGMAPRSAMEHIMFLAEDRVIGNEIVLASGKPQRLDFCAGAIATTDACDSLGELLRQRRRWNNCSFACRLWLLAHSAGMLARTDRALRDKLRFCTAMLWQLLLALQQAAIPACVLCTSGVVWLAVAQAWRSGHSGLALLATALSLLTAPLTLWNPASRHAMPIRRLAGAWAVARDVVATTALILLIATVMQVLPFGLTLLVFAPPIVLATLPCLARGRCSLVPLRHAAEFIWINGFVQSMLWAYSLARLHDTSWGTKGLVAGGTRRLSRSMCRYSRVTIALTLGVNAALIGAALALPGWWLAPSNPVTEGFGLIGALAVLMALGGRLRMAWPRRRTIARAPAAASPVRDEPGSAGYFATEESLRSRTAAPSRMLDAA